LPTALCRAEKQNKVVDGKNKTPHNLISVLLTNKTIRRRCQELERADVKQEVL
jgi:hypothetical protein